MIEDERNNQHMRLLVDSEPLIVHEIRTCLLMTNNKLPLTTNTEWNKLLAEQVAADRSLSHPALSPHLGMHLACAQPVFKLHSQYQNHAPEPPFVYLSEYPPIISPLLSVTPTVQCTPRRRIPAREGGPVPRCGATRSSQRARHIIIMIHHASKQITETPQLT